MRCSRSDRNVLLFVMIQYLIAFNSHIFHWMFHWEHCMRIRYFVICLHNSSSIDRSSASCCKAVIDVILKHPVIIFIASHCTDVRLVSWEVGVFRVSSDLCQITAPYWILGLIAAVYKLLTYLNGAPHMIFVILDNVRANLIPFLMT